jgi:tetratricopeptide (TPR) repeat protein
MNRPPEAELLLRESLAIRKRISGENHHSIAVPLVNIGALYIGLNELDNAVDSYRQAAAIRTSTLGKDHPDTAIASASTGFALWARNDPGDIREAVPLLRDAYKVLEKAEGPLDERTLVTLRNLAAAVLREGDAQEAERLLEEVLRRSEKKGKRPAWRVADARSLLGEALMDQNRFAEARPLLEGAAEIIAAGKNEQDSLYERDARARWQRWLKEH